jgi:hypothetical protein
MSFKYAVNSIIAILILSAGFISCDSSDKADLINSDNTQSLQPQPQKAANAADVFQAQTVSSAQALNPKHGAPGHRCDIPVGAPLNSPVGNTKPAITMPSLPLNANTPTVNTTPAPAVSLPQSTVAGKLNPKHGEPGHRCDIPVGAPLNSPPAATNPVANVNPKPAATLPQQAAPAGLKINPKHGEPGHRCDIAVGAPL